MQECNTVLIAIYKSPNNVTYFCEILDSILSDIHINTQIIVVGDFNIDLNTHPNTVIQSQYYSKFI